MQPIRTVTPGQELKVVLSGKSLAPDERCSTEDALKSRYVIGVEAMMSAKFPFLAN